MSKIISNIVELCIFKKNIKIQYLVLQRSNKEKLYPNLWQLLTGTKESNETEKKTLLRELYEETNLKPINIYNVPYIDSYYNLEKDAVQLCPIFAVEVDKNDKIKLSKEHQKYKWLNYKSAYKLLVWPGQRQILKIVNQYIVDNKNIAMITKI